MRPSTRLVPFVAILALVLSACSGDDAPTPDEPETAPEAPTADVSEEARDADPDEEPADDGAGASAESAAPIGTVDVDGTTYGITEVLRCEPYDDGTIERELELQGFGQSADGTRVQIDVYVAQLAGMPFDDVSWSGPEGVYGGPEDPDVNLTDGNVSGSALLHQAMGDGTTVAISFDLPVPADTFACR